jgi:hypothetical protein
MGKANHIIMDDNTHPSNATEDHVEAVDGSSGMGGRRNQEVFHDVPLWYHPKTFETYFSEEESDACIRKIGEETMGFGDPESCGVGLITKNWQDRKRDNVRTKRIVCHFHTETRGGCKWVAKQTHCLTEDSYCFEIGTCRCSWCRRQVIIQVRSK